MLGHLSTIRDQPVWREMPAEVREVFGNPMPEIGVGEEAAYASFFKNVLPYPNGNLHPRFWGWVHGNGFPMAMMADMLASGIDPHLAGYNQAPARVEDQVLEWMKELMGFPAGASGLLVSGGTVASVTALAIGRQAKAGYDIRKEGIHGPRMMIYGSTEVHGWAKKACAFLGLGTDSLRLLPVNERYEMDLDALRSAVAADRAAGLRPFFVVGTAGTVNTGATDDLHAIADFCQAEDLWFHVDGAYGALAKASPATRDIVSGLERADSLAFDLHKWMYLPFDIACVLVREGGLMKETFTQKASYLAETSRGVIAGGLPFAERGIELSRSFKALKAWLSIQAYGMDKFGRIIAENVRQAHALAEAVKQHPDLELMAPTELNIVCFRFAPAAADPVALDALNEEILIRLQERGIAIPSSTVIKGRYALRCSITNHRTRREDLTILVEAVVSLGYELLTPQLPLAKP